MDNGTEHGSPDRTLGLAPRWTGALAELPIGTRFGMPSRDAQERLVPVACLAEHLDDMLAAMRLHYRGDDRRALISQWSKWYFKTVLPAAIGHAVILHRPLAIPLADCTLALCGGLPHALWLPASAAGAAVEDTAARYRSLCIEHLAPLIDALSAAVQISPRVLWSNAGNLIEYVLSLLIQAPQHAQRARADAAVLFGPDDFLETGEANPLRAPVRYVIPPSPGMENPFRVRRVCCLRNRLPGEPLCAACPLLLAMRKD